MSELKKVLMERDGLSEKEADERIVEASALLKNRLDNGELPYDFMADEFGLEPDYLMELL